MTIMTQDPVTQSRRQVPMEVLCLGFSRTGTNSLCKALEVLGMRSYHAFELLDSPDSLAHCEKWDRAIGAKFFGKGKPFDRAAWDDLLGDYGAVTDVPSICFADELMETYPDAKVVLVERDIERWYQSFDVAVIQNVFNPVLNAVAFFDHWYLGPILKIHQDYTRGWIGARTMAETQAMSRPFYRKHYAHVRAVTPVEKLFEYKLGSGWEPLCKFLRKPVPDVPFPHVNEAAALDKKIQGVIRKGMVSVAKQALVYLVIPTVALGTSYRYYLTN
ncbi:efflux pump antibiotic resistance protein [Xylariaceae sp. FL1019]|nr:efflux pump antibiotic resistance protein [Xylariaceae sp. FL1019]